MKRFRNFALLLAATALTTNVRAQVLNGDMNHNGELDVEDITMIINGYLGGEKEWLNAQYTNTADGYEFVDLGLSVKWATMNLGATSPEEYGDYYAWGETQTKDAYDWNNYQWSDDGCKTFTKYNTGKDYGTVDNRTMLDFADDAARASWGGTWRLPTRDELEELCEQCTWTKATQKGVKGYKVTGPSGKSIFLPAAGYRSESSLVNDGSMGYYWSSSLNAATPLYAYFLHFNSDGVHWNYSERYRGRPIRAVCEITAFVPEVSLNKTELELQQDKTFKLTATVIPSDAGTVTWSSSDESVATVKDGLVTAVAAGTVTITAGVAGAEAVCTVTVIGKTAVSKIALSATSLSMDITDGSQPLTVTVYPPDATDKSLTWTSSNTAVATVSSTGTVTPTGAGTATITVKSNDGSDVQATCTVTVTDKYNGYEYVDLGLSVKWATMNVGASAPEEYGDYFAWGETEPRYYYTWENYKWRDGKYCTDPDYGTVDNKTILDLEDDAAHANWGGTWRMPTHDEFEEFRTKCSWVWTTQSGVNGLKVTGPNGNSIFLPAAGFRWIDNLSQAGSNGYHWSSSLSPKYDSEAYGLDFDSGGTNWYWYGCAFGSSVRAVCP